MSGNSGTKDAEPFTGKSLPPPTTAVTIPIADTQPDANKTPLAPATTVIVPNADSDANPPKSNSHEVATAIGRSEHPKRSPSLRRFRYLLKAFTEILGNLGKWLATLVTLFLLALVGYRAFQDHSIKIGTIVVPKDLEDRGYTSRTVGERLRYEIDKIVREPQTSAKKEQFALSGDSELPDIEVPKRAAVLLPAV